MKRSSAPSTRRTTAVESFKTAADCIGPITKGLSLFALTRGQFSMIDAIMHCIDQIGPCEVSLWTWTVAEYEIQCLETLMACGKITTARLIIDHGARVKNLALIRQWKARFGENSVRYVLNHAKIATLKNDKFKLLLRGSMNLNFNPRFEQFDITEGCAGYDLVKEIEDELPILADDCAGKEPYRASKVGQAFSKEQLSCFDGLKVWAK